MKRLATVLTLTVGVVLAELGGRAVTAQDTSQAKYNVRVPNGLAFSEFKRYEGWQTVGRQSQRKGDGGDPRQSRDD